MKKINLNVNVPGAELVPYDCSVIHIYIKNPRDPTARPEGSGSTICSVISELKLKNPDTIEIEALMQILPIQPDCDEFVLILRNP